MFTRPTGSVGTALAGSVFHRVRAEATGSKVRSKRGAPEVWMLSFLC